MEYVFVLMTVLGGNTTFHGDTTFATLNACTDHIMRVEMTLGMPAKNQAWVCLPENDERLN